MNQPDRRTAPREEIFYRARALAPGQAPVPLQIVDISASGFMARTDFEYAAGDSFAVRLPTLGEVEVQVRWSLGGRIGCQFARMIELAPYLDLLGALMKETR